MDLKNMINLFDHKNVLYGQATSARLQNVKKIRFCTMPAINSEPMVSTESRVVLLTLRTLVSYPFSFPFGRNGNVRDALTMAFRPILGERENLLSMALQITEQGSDTTKGVAWFVSKSEIEELEISLGSDVVFWPAPVAFASEVGGNGLVIWCDREGTSAIWFENYVPSFYRWMPPAEGDAGPLAEWMLKYAETNGKEISSVKVIVEGKVSNSEIQRCGEAALESVKGLGMLDLSNKGADHAQQLESFFSAGFKAVKVLSILGIIFVVLSSLLLMQNFIQKKSFASAPTKIYRTAFGEDSKNPLTSSNRKLRLLAGEGSQMTLEQTLSNFAAAWKDTAAAAAIKMDSVRYGAERTEIQGNADSINSIEALRDSLNKNGFSAKVGEVQQIPGSGLRFSITLMGEKQ